MARRTATSATPASIDEYIAAFPPPKRSILEKVRATIAAAAPGAREVISYRMPAFARHGILIYFAAFKAHVGVYPPISGDPALERALSRYAGPKGNLRFPLDQPIPYALIKRIVRLRLTQDMARAAAAASRPRARRASRARKEVRAARPANRTRR